MAPSSDDIWDGLDIKMEHEDVKMEQNFDIKLDNFDMKLEDFDMKMDSFDVNTPPMSPEWRNDNKDYVNFNEFAFPFQSLIKPGFESSAVVPDIGDINFDPTTIDDLSDLKFDLDFMNTIPDSPEYMSNLEELENQEAVRYDCMWSSVAPGYNKSNNHNNINNTNNATATPPNHTNNTTPSRSYSRKRDRDNVSTSATSSPIFLESMSTDDDNLVQGVLSSSPLCYSSPVTPLLSSSPLATSLACLDTPLYSEVSDIGDTAEVCYSDNDADDEIDVVSDSSSCETNQSLMLQKTDTSRVRVIRNKHKPHTSSQQHHTNIPDDNPYGDHCYVISAQANNRSVDPSILGILTPTESSEDEELSNTGFPNLLRSQQGFKYHYRINGDSKKRAAMRANNQSLIKKPGIADNENNRNSHNSTNTNNNSNNQTKFKFHMKFKSQKPRSVLRQKSAHHVKRKAAVKNTFCPNPTQQIQVRQTKVVPATLTTSSPPHHTSPHHHHGKRASREAPQFVSKRSRDSPQKDKGQEVRDLHNTMERQRRIELKDALEEVKLSVPSIAHAERASKLTILTKATDYCHSLSTTSIKLRREMANEKNKNVVLKKKLRALQAQLSKTTVM